MPTVKRRRRAVKRTATEPVVGNIAYRVLHKDGTELAMVSAPLWALVRAQTFAERVEGKRECEYHVVSAPIFGEPSLLYRVVRDEDGTVLTYTVSLED